MQAPNFLVCPHCHSGSLRGSTANVICDECGRTFPVLLGIVDFRDAELDRTAAFSIVADRLLATHLSSAFSKVTTFNELYTIYTVLRTKQSDGDDLTEVDIGSVIREQKIVPEALSSTQLVHGRAILEKISEYIKPMPYEMPLNNFALENGCGLGYFIDGLASYFKNLAVLDFSLSYLVLARKIVEERSLGNVTLICGSVERLPFRKDSFDFIHSNNVIEHISDQRAMFNEAKRVLNSKGLLFVLSPNRFSMYFEPHFRLPGYGFFPEPIRRKIIQHWQHRDIDDISLLSLRELRDLASEQFGKNTDISFIPRYLNKTVTG